MLRFFDGFYGLMDETEGGAGGGMGGGSRLPKPKIGLPGRQPQHQQPQQQAEPEEYADSDYTDPEYTGPDYTGADYQGPEEQQPQAPDWRKQALDDPEVRARFDKALFGEQQQPEPIVPQEHPLDVAQRELDEVEAELEQFGGLKPEQLKDSAAVTRYFELSDKRGRAASKVARLSAESARYLQRQQYASRAEQENYQQFAQQDPNFTDEAQAGFPQYLKDRGISQELMADPVVFQTVAKSYLYERGTGGGQRQKMPAPPIGQGHTRQPVPQPQEPVDPDAEAKAQFWGTSPESVQKRNSTEDGKQLQYEKGGHDVPYLRYSDTSGRRRRRSA